MRLAFFVGVFSGMNEDFNHLMVACLSTQCSSWKSMPGFTLYNVNQRSSACMLVPCIPVYNLYVNLGAVYAVEKGLIFQLYIPVVLFLGQTNLLDIGPPGRSPKFLSLMAHPNLE